MAELAGGDALVASRRSAKTAAAALRRALEALASLAIAILVAPLLVGIAVAIKLDSRGPVLYRCRRIGYHGRAFDMLKFRKMRDGASGASLTSADDERFTRLGRFLAATKLDELPQLWNVLNGEMSFVGPRPEDPSFVDIYRDAYTTILQVRPGITGLSQLAFATESALLTRPDNTDFYIEHLLPQKLSIDTLYLRHRSPSLDLQIVLWTLIALVLPVDVAVDRHTARLTVRHRRRKRER